ncbi:hypothetical protein V4Y02_23715, partial [Escherichia coli]
FSLGLWEPNKQPPSSAPGSQQIKTLREKIKMEDENITGLIKKKKNVPTIFSPLHDVKVQCIQMWLDNTLKMPVTEERPFFSQTSY